MAQYQLTDDSNVVIERPGPKQGKRFLTVDSGHSLSRRYLSWLAAGGVPDPPYQSPPPTLDELDAEAARQHAKLTTLRGLSPDQAQAWVDANVNTLEDAKDVLKTLVVAVSVLSRRL
jgi:hypothetical protein